MLWLPISASAIPLKHSSKASAPFGPDADLKYPVDMIFA